MSINRQDDLDVQTIYTSSTVGTVFANHTLPILKVNPSHKTPNTNRYTLRPTPHRTQPSNPKSIEFEGYWQKEHHLAKCLPPALCSIARIASFVVVRKYLGNTAVNCQVSYQRDVTPTNVITFTNVINASHKRNN